MLRILLALYGIAVITMLGYGIQFFPPFTHPELFDRETLFLGRGFYVTMIIVHGYFVYRAGQMSPNRLGRMTIM